MLHSSQSGWAAGLLMPSMWVQVVCHSLLVPYFLSHPFLTRRELPCALRCFWTGIGISREDRWHAFPVGMFVSYDC